jgi:hypothetical protein
VYEKGKWYPDKLPQKEGFLKNKSFKNHTKKSQTIKGKIGFH